MTTIGGFGVTDGPGEGGTLCLTGGEGHPSGRRQLGEGDGVAKSGEDDGCGLGVVGGGVDWQRGKLGLTLQIPARRSFPIGLLSTFWANSLTEATTTTPTTTAAKRAIGTMPLLRPIYFKHGTGLRCCQEICPQDTPVSKLNLWSKKKKKMR